MAKIKTKTKTKTSIFLCCFGSHLPKKEKEPDDHITKQKRSRWLFSWLRIRMNTKSTSKTVPLEASFSNVNKAYSKSRSKSSTVKSQAQLTNPPPPPTQPPLVLPGTPYYTPSQVFIWYSCLCLYSIIHPQHMLAMFFCPIITYPIWTVNVKKVTKLEKYSSWMNV